jgi:hypothetical protein
MEKPIWKRTIEGVMYGDFLDGRGIVALGAYERELLGTNQKNWSKQENCHVTYVFKPNKVILEVTMCGLRYINLSEKQSKIIKGYYKEE